MLPLSEWLSIIKDAAIVGAVGFLVYFIYHSGANSVRVADMQAVQKQLAANAATQERYHSEINDAFAEANSQMGNLAHSIDANRKPVIVRFPSGSGPVSSCPTSTDSGTAGPGGSDPNAGEDIRPQLNEAEKWLEQRFAECRALKAAWPK